MERSSDRLAGGSSRVKAHAAEYAAGLIGSDGRLGAPDGLRARMGCLGLGDRDMRRGKRFVPLSWPVHIGLRMLRVSCTYHHRRGTDCWWLGSRGRMDGGCVLWAHRGPTLLYVIYEESYVLIRSLLEELQGGMDGLAGFKRRPPVGINEKQLMF